MELISIIFKNSKRRDIKNGKNNIFLDALSLIIVFGTLSIAMIYFSIYVTRKLEQINQSFAFINLLLLMNFMILFVKSIFESLNVLYFSKDLKTFLRMPIKSKKLINAKLINMIVSEYQMELIMLAIPMIVYGILNNVNFIFYIYMIFELLILPIIPIALTSLLISIIMRFTNFIKNKSKVMYLTIIISSILIGMITSLFVSGDNSISNFEKIILTTNGLSETIANRFVLIKPIMNCMLNYNNIEGLKNLIIFVIENLICYLICLIIMSKIYLKGVIGTTINSNKKIKVNEKLSITDFKDRTIKKAYLEKEYNTSKRSPIFFLQCILMPIIYPITILLIIVGMVLFARMVGVDIWINLVKATQNTYGIAIILAVGQVFFMMNFNSIIAVSKEASYAKLLKYLPISLEKQFKYKISLGFKINFVAIILDTIVSYFCTYNILYTLLIFICLIILDLLGEKYKLMKDLSNPRTNWNSEYTMMKENTNVMYVLFYTLFVGLILYLVSLITNNVLLYLLFILILLLIINISVNNYIRKNQNKIFEKLF